MLSKEESIRKLENNLYNINEIKQEEIDKRNLYMSNLPKINMKKAMWYTQKD